MSNDADVIVIGGGLAGLACAHSLNKMGRTSLLLEADERIGGRIKTDKKDGFLLDRGFQVLQTAYPEARSIFNYHQLDLRFFAPGVDIRIGNRFHTVADPMRHPQKLLNTLRAPIGTLGDRLRLVRLARKVNSVPLENLFQERETSTIEFLRNQGFSETMINRFFVPFFGGASLDRNMTASSRVFKYILRMFASGDAALPEKGMEELPKQLAEQLPNGTIQTSSRVESLHRGHVVLDSGAKFSARAVVVATEGMETMRLLNVKPTGGSVGETCLYFAGEEEAFHSPFLVLNGNTSGPINNIAFPSMVSPAYAPTGKSLISVVVLGRQEEEPDQLFSAVHRQLIEWYGRPIIDSWTHLETYSINHALPAQLPPTHDPTSADPMLRDGLFVCGEHQSLPAIQWALFSGRRAAEAVAEYIQR